jgi:hypothetical protein
VEVTTNAPPLPAETVTFTCTSDKKDSAAVCTMPNGSQFTAGTDGKVSLTGLTVSGATGGITVTASAGPDKFTPVQFHLTVAPAPTITVSPTPPFALVTGGGLYCGGNSGPCSVSAPGPGPVTLNVNPYSLVFAGWSGACAGQANPCTVVPTTSQSVSVEVGTVITQFGGMCAYSCCDSQGNCSTSSVVVNDCSACTWNSICTPDNPGYSASPYPEGAQYSKLSCTPGCWKYVQYQDGTGAAIIPCSWIP